MAKKVFKLKNWEPGYDGATVSSVNLESSPELESSSGTAPYLDATVAYGPDRRMFELIGHVIGGNVEAEDPNLIDSLRNLHILEEVS